MSELSQWSPSSSTRRDALRQEGGPPPPYQFPVSRGGASAPAYQEAPLPPSRLRQLWNAFWAVFFFSVICGILGVTVNNNLRIRGIPGGGACVAAAAADTVLGLPAPLASATWNNVLSLARVRARRGAAVAPSGMPCVAWLRRR